MISSTRSAEALGTHWVAGPSCWVGGVFFGVALSATSQLWLRCCQAGQPSCSHDCEVTGHTRETPWKPAATNSSGSWNAPATPMSSASPSSSSLSFSTGSRTPPPRETTVKTILSTLTEYMINALFILFTFVLIASSL